MFYFHVASNECRKPLSFVLEVYIKIRHAPCVVEVVFSGSIKQINDVIF